MKEVGEQGETEKEQEKAKATKLVKNEKYEHLSVTNGLSLSLNLNLKKNELLNIII